MTTRFTRLIVVAAVLAWAVARVHAADGIVVTQKIASAGGTQTTESQITKTHMRTEITDPTGSRQLVLFDGPRQVLQIVSVDRKTYTELTRADIDQMAQQMQAMMAQIPPGQRAQMEAMMRGRGMPGMDVSARVEYRRAGSGQVGRWACDKYEGYQSGQKVTEICTVAPSALGFTVADFEVAQQLSQFFARLMPQMATQVASVGRLDEQGFAGYPIRTVTFVMGREITAELSEARRQAIADAAFAVPAGFQKQDMMGGMGMGRR